MPGMAGEISPQMDWISRFAQWLIPQQTDSNSVRQPAPQIPKPWPMVPTSPDVQTDFGPTRFQPPHQQFLQQLQPDPLYGFSQQSADPKYLFQRGFTGHGPGGSAQLIPGQNVAPAGYQVEPGSPFDNWLSQLPRR